MRPPLDPGPARWPTSWRLHLLVRPGEEFLTDVDAHVVTYELGADGGVRRGSGPGPYRELVEVAGMIRLDGYPRGPTAAVFVENTHNRRGGIVVPLPTWRRCARWAREDGVAVHCDGAGSGTRTWPRGSPSRSTAACSTPSRSVCQGARCAGGLVARR